MIPVANLSSYGLKTNLSCVASHRDLFYRMGHANLVFSGYSGFTVCLLTMEP